MLLTPLGSKVTISFKVRFRVGISASHYGANGAIYIAAGRKCPPVQLQRVRTSTGTIGVPDAASNCYLHKGRPFNICMHAPTSAFTLLPHVVVLLLLALCGGGGCVWWWLVNN